MLSIIRLVVLGTLLLACLPAGAAQYRCPLPDGSLSKEWTPTCPSAPNTTDAAPQEKRTPPQKVSSADLISQACLNEWGDDYRMREWCEKKHRKAEARIAEILSTDATSDPEMGQIMGRCLNEWRDNLGGYDHPMVVWCYEKQSSARNRLAR